MKKIIILVIVLSLIGGFLFWRFGMQANLPGIVNPDAPVTLTFWSLWEEENMMKPLIEEYQKQNPNVTVVYERKSSINYRTRTQTQIREGQGADVFMIHNTWLPMFKNFLAPAPNDVFTAEEYRSTFYPVAYESFVSNNQVFAAPMEIDGLALYYNEDMLQQVGNKIPQNWQEFLDIATRMTVKDQTGIKVSGAAMGTASNVDHFSDILGLLFLQQPGVFMENLATPQAAEVFRFYTSFVKDPAKKTWDVNLPTSTQMFAEGRLGFYFAPSWRAHELRQMNPNLKFKTAPVPQLVGRQVGWGTFWGFAVPSNSKSSAQAWKFIKYLTSKDAEKLAYQQASQERLFGQPYSRVDLGEELKGDPLVGAFVSQGPIYKSWYLASRTMDNGVNDEMIKYFEDGINTTLSGQDPQHPLQTVAKGVTQVLSKYTGTPAPPTE